MKEQELDYLLVPLGLLVMMAYHIGLLHKTLKEPSKTLIGIHAINRRCWVHAMMEDISKNGILAVQTLRNNIMASTLLASTAITLSSVIAVVMTNQGSKRALGLVFGDQSQLGLSLKFLAILVCFLMAFLLNLQSIRYYSHASVLINVPSKNKASPPPPMAVEYVCKIVNKGGYFWSLGLRAFYFSFPLFLWIFGPIPMFCSSLALVFLCFFLDFTFEFNAVGNGEFDNRHHEEQEVV